MACQPKAGNESPNLPKWGVQIVARKLESEALYGLAPNNRRG